MYLKEWDLQSVARPHNAASHFGDYTDRLCIIGFSHLTEESELAWPKDHVVPCHCRTNALLSANQRLQRRCFANKKELNTTQHCLLEKDRSLVKSSTTYGGYLWVSRWDPTTKIPLNSTASLQVTTTSMHGEELWKKSLSSSTFRRHDDMFSLNTAPSHQLTLRRLSLIIRIAEYTFHLGKLQTQLCFQVSFS